MEQWRRWALALAVIGLVAAGTSCSDEGADADASGPVSSTSTTVELPDQDLSIPIEPGRIVFHQWGDGSPRQLAEVDVDGAPVGELSVAGYGGVLSPAVGPDGRLAALAWEPGDNERSTTVLLGGADHDFEPLYTDPHLVLHCVRWLPDGSGLLLTAFDGDEVDPVLLSLDLDGNATQIEVPSGRYECALPLADGRIVLTYTGEGTDLVAMALANPGSGDVEVLHTKVGCLLYGPSPSWTRPELVVAASCESPEDSGVHLIDLETGEVDHVLAGEVAFPSFSPSGDWIAFGLFPSPDSLKSTVWAVSRQGQGLRQITDQIGAMPAWVGPAS